MISENINTHSIDFRVVSWQGWGEEEKAQSPNVSSKSDNSENLRVVGLTQKSLLWGGIMFSGTTQIISGLLQYILGFM